MPGSTGQRGSREHGGHQGSTRCLVVADPAGVVAAPLVRALLGRRLRIEVADDLPMAAALLAGSGPVEAGDGGRGQATAFDVAIVCEAHRHAAWHEFLDAVPLLSPGTHLWGYRWARRSRGEGRLDVLRAATPPTTEHPSPNHLASPRTGTTATIALAPPTPDAPAYRTQPKGHPVRPYPSHDESDDQHNRPRPNHPGPMPIPAAPLPPAAPAPAVPQTPAAALPPADSPDDRQIPTSTTISREELNMLLGPLPTP